MHLISLDFVRQIWARVERAGEREWNQSINLQDIKLGPNCIICYNFCYKLKQSLMDGALDTASIILLLTLANSNKEFYHQQIFPINIHRGGISGFCFGKKFRGKILMSQYCGTWGKGRLSVTAVRDAATFNIWFTHYKETIFWERQIFRWFYYREENLWCVRICALFTGKS